MIDRTELLEAALDSLPEGVALFGTEGEVIFWNQAAQGITGYAAMDVLAQTLPEGLELLQVEEIRNEAVPGGTTLPESRRAVVRAGFEAAELGGGAEDAEALALAVLESKLFNFLPHGAVVLGTQ